MSSVAITAPDVARARAKLARMQRSLVEWLRFRQLNDLAATGKAAATRPEIAARAAAARPTTELALARQLHALLAELMPDAQLPAPEASNAAAALAQIAISGTTNTRAPQAQGAAWLSWPVLIVGGLLLAITTAIKSSADLAKERERLACVQAGACTDYGFWLKVGGIAAIAFVAWHHFGLREHAKRALGSGR